MGTLTAVALIAALLFWFIRPGRRAEKLPEEDDGEPAIERAELEAAEREVRDLDAGQRPVEDFEGDDWGPGTPRPPERL